MNGYKTLIKSVCAEYVIKRSRFLCYATPVSCEEDTTAFIKEISTKHWDARHNVWAYTLREGQRLRYSDDGEPQGTAGLPVLEAMRSRGITDSLIVVTRYFGGILLGASGLTRAYAHSAGLGIEASGIVVMQACVHLRLVLSYAEFNQLGRVLLRLKGVFTDTIFADKVTVCFDLPEIHLPKFREFLAEFVTKAQNIEILGKGYLPQSS